MEEPRPGGSQKIGKPLTLAVNAESHNELSLVSISKDSNAIVLYNQQVNFVWCITVFC